MKKYCKPIAAGLTALTIAAGSLMMPMPTAHAFGLGDVVGGVLGGGIELQR